MCADHDASRRNSDDGNERLGTPPPPADGRVPIDEVDTAVAGLFGDFEVWRLYADPSKWQGPLATWAGRYGQERVLSWEPTRTIMQARALRAFSGAMAAGEISHDGSPVLAGHIGNAYKRLLPQRDEDGAAMWVIQKERPNSPHKIDAAQAACWSWWARVEAIAQGVDLVTAVPPPDVW